MPQKLVISRIDSRDGFTLHGVEIGQAINAENIRRLQTGEDLIEACEKVTSPGPQPGQIMTLLSYR